MGVPRPSPLIPSGSDGKESACNVGDPGSVPGLGKSPGGGQGHPLQCSSWRIPWTEEPGGYSSWGHKESDTTERLTLHPSHLNLGPL